MAGRYEGTRWKIVYGSDKGIERTALFELQRNVQTFHPYVLSIEPSTAEVKKDEDHLILSGTAETHPLIAELRDRQRISIPEKAEGYTLGCFDSIWGEGKRLIVIAGRDSRGVLYGVQDFASRVLPFEVLPEEPSKMRQAFDAMPNFSITEQPAIENRGIWTWGYVIYDYRRFIDHMVRLKMNTLTVWNDCPPLNLDEILEHAHARGVRVVLGFHWGWGLSGLNLASTEDRRKIREMVVTNYRENYKDRDIDGIYFQTLTEHNNLEMGEMSTASAACRLVNEISAALFEITPGLYIQFGLHATSIRERYVDLKPLDQRVVIIWEDAGGIPFCYHPKPPEGDYYQPDATLEYGKKLATFREGTEFGMVPKGWINLRWGSEFEHHGPFILGERDPGFIRKRFLERRPHWERVNALWLEKFPVAMQFYREILACNPRKMTVTGLVEDGMFEEAIQPSVALFGETIWNPERDENEIRKLALSPYFRAAG